MKFPKYFVRAATFCIIAGLIFSGMSAILKHKGGGDGSSYARNYALYEIEKKTFNAVAFGASTAQWGFSPRVLYNEYGISAWNLGCEGQPLMTSYFLLEEFLKRQSPNIVLVEAHYLFVDATPSFNRIPLDHLRPSLDKFKAIAEYSALYSNDENADTMLSYYFTVYKYHTRWKELSYIDVRNPYRNGKGSGVFKLGQFPVTAIMSETDYADVWTDTGDEKAEYNKTQYDYMLRIIELCESKGIDIVLFKTPVTSDAFWDRSRHNMTKALADNFGIEFVDFNMQTEYGDSGFDYKNDMADDAHINARGANKISSHLGKVLKEHYDLPDRRTDIEKEYAKFATTRNLSEYLDLLEQNNYAAFFAIKDSGTNGLNDSILEKLAEFGFISDFRDKFHHGFIGVYQDGLIAYEDIADSVTEALEWNTLLSGGETVTVKSAGYECGNIGSIIIDNTEYSQQLRGFNIVVYDTENHKVVDSVNFDTHVDSGLTWWRR
jgi:hypothetical protein